MLNHKQAFLYTNSVKHINIGLVVCRIVRNRAYTGRCARTKLGTVRGYLWDDGECYTPKQGCWKPIVNKAFAGGTAVAAVGALFMFLTFFISLSLCGDKPDSPDEEATAVEKIQ